MASETLARLHRQFSESPVGSCVIPVEPYRTRAARTIRKWQALKQLGAVRLIAEVDEDCDPTEYGGSADDEAFGSVGQYRTDFVNQEWDTEDDDIFWVTAASVWGHVGYRDVLDWRENAYIVDIMRETIEAFRDAWKAHVRADIERREES